LATKSAGVFESASTAGGLVRLTLGVAYGADCASSAALSFPAPRGSTSAPIAPDGRSALASIFGDNLSMDVVAPTNCPSVGGARRKCAIGSGASPVFGGRAASCWCIASDALNCSATSDQELGGVRRNSSTSFCSAAGSSARTSASFSITPAMSLAFGSEAPGIVGGAADGTEVLVTERVGVAFANGVDHGRMHPTTDAINAQHANNRNTLVRRKSMRAVP
jgi:hypothetical protein